MPELSFCLPLAGVRRLRRTAGASFLASSLASCLLVLGCSSSSSNDTDHVDSGSASDSGNHPDARPRDAAPARDGGAPETAPPPSVDASGPVAARMNDVSILFPLPSSKAEIDDLLAPSAVANGGVLLASDLYASAGAIAGTTLAIDASNGKSAAYDALRVVAMRLDPCFASLDPDPHGAHCTAQLRLIFQEVTWQEGDPGPGSANAFDSALHVFYDLTRDDLVALARALVALRVANEAGEAEGALAPHPIIEHQGLHGAMSQGVKRLITQYVGTKQIVRLAEFSTVDNELEEIWGMSAFDVGDDKAVATPRPVPTLTDDGGVLLRDSLGGTSSAVAGDGGLILSASFLATRASLDDFAPLDDGKPDELTQAQREAALHALARVENPKYNSPNTIDCARCHAATPTEELVARPLFAFDDTSDPASFEPDGVYVTQKDLAPTYHRLEGQFNIHAFSYFGTQPGISQRTANETAAVVAYLNALPK